MFDPAGLSSPLAHMQSSSSKVTKPPDQAANIEASNPIEHVIEEQIPTQNDLRFGRTQAFGQSVTGEGLPELAKPETIKAFLLAHCHDAPTLVSFVGNKLTIQVGQETLFMRAEDFKGALQHRSLDPGSTLARSVLMGTLLGHLDLPTRAIRHLLSHFGQKLPTDPEKIDKQAMGEAIAYAATMAVLGTAVESFCQDPGGLKALERLIEKLPTAVKGGLPIANSSTDPGVIEAAQKRLQEALTAFTNTVPAALKDGKYEPAYNALCNLFSIFDQVTGTNGATGWFQADLKVAERHQEVCSTIRDAIVDAQVRQPIPGRALTPLLQAKLTLPTTTAWQAKQGWQDWTLSSLTGTTVTFVRTEEAPHKGQRPQTEVQTMPLSQLLLENLHILAKDTEFRLTGESDPVKYRGVEKGQLIVNDKTGSLRTIDPSLISDLDAAFNLNTPAMTLNVATFPNGSTRSVDPHDLSKLDPEATVDKHKGVFVYSPPTTPSGLSQSKEFERSGRLLAPIEDGFCSHGVGHCLITDKGTIRGAGLQTEVLVVDRGRDPVLRHYLALATEIRDEIATHDTLSPEQKQEAIALRLMSEVYAAFGGAQKNVEGSVQQWAATHAHQAVPLGEVIATGSGVCRHRALLFALMAQEAGLKVSLVKGNLRGEGAHEWNEVTIGKGVSAKKLIVDASNDAGNLLDPASPIWQRRYRTVDGKPVYPASKPPADSTASHGTLLGETVTYKGKTCAVQGIGWTTVRLSALPAKTLESNPSTDLSKTIKPSPKLIKSEETAGPGEVSWQELLTENHQRLIPPGTQVHDPEDRKQMWTFAGIDNGAVVLTHRFPLEEKARIKLVKLEGFVAHNIDLLAPLPIVTSGLPREISQAFLKTHTLKGPIPDGFVYLGPGSRLNDDGELTMATDKHHAAIIIDRQRDLALHSLMQKAADIGQAKRTNFFRNTVPPKVWVKDVSNALIQLILDKTKTKSKEDWNLTHNWSPNFIGSIPYMHGPGKDSHHAFLFSILAEASGITSAATISVRRGLTVDKKTSEQTPITWNEISLHDPKETHVINTEGELITEKAAALLGTFRTVDSKSAY